MALYAFRHGQQKIVSVAVDSATVIAIGDMLFLDTDDAKPAASFTWDTNLATTQANFAALFIGISLHLSESGDTDDVDIDISADSVYEYTTASATYEFGATLGPDKDTGNALLSSVLEAATGTSAIARCIKKKASATALLVNFASAYNCSANNANTPLG